ncbi:MAG: hypothetical protein WD066_17360 [Planctomycetaceae bacterium]
MPCCERCRFFHAHPPADAPGRITISGDGIRGGGECRLHPPVRVEHETLACFPVVANEDWCGRFEAGACTP